MNLLQIQNDSIRAVGLPTNSTELLFYIEIVIIGIIIVWQLSHSYRLYYNIIELRTIFKNKLSVRKDDLDESTDRATLSPLVVSDGENEVNSRIKKTLNSYLTNNYGAPVNFSIIKDIIDREVEVKDESISEAIPTPLYLGLSGTMIGIIFGLFGMPTIDGEGFSGGINSLVVAIQIAMIASLTGLICTTILSSFFYKNAKRITLMDKNDLLSDLQAELLPELIKAEDTGFSGLRASIDKFTREATEISKNVKDAADKTETNLKYQEEIIQKVERLNVTKVSRTNLELFDRLDKNMEIYSQFTQYLGSMNKISENLVKFSNKTESVETIANKINSTLSKSQDVLDFMQSHSKALIAHVEQIEMSGSASAKAVNLADSVFREAIENLKVEIINRMDTLSSLSDTIDSKLTEIFDGIGIKLNKITEGHLNSLTEAYNNSTPHFANLDKLNLLPEMKDESFGLSKELISAVKELNTSLDTINNQMNNHAILSKLDAIENNLKRRTSMAKTNGEVKPIKVGFFKRIRNKFTRKIKNKVSEEE